MGRITPLREDIDYTLTFIYNNKHYTIDAVASSINIDVPAPEFEDIHSMWDIAPHRYVTSQQPSSIIIQNKDFGGKQYTVAVKDVPEVMTYPTITFESKHPQLDARRVMREKGLDPTKTEVTIERTGNGPHRVTLAWMELVQFKEPVIG